MTRHKMTIRGAAEIACVPSSTINNWRSGAIPDDIFALKRLASHFGCSLSYLLTGEQEIPPVGASPGPADIITPTRLRLRIDGVPVLTITLEDPDRVAIETEEALP